MNVRAKFTCTEVTKSLHWDRSKGFAFRAKFVPVTAGSPENDAFYVATPGGAIELSTYCEDHFVPGQSYYIDFVPAT